MTDADHFEEFINLLDDYLIPATMHDFGAWTTEDLVRLSELIDIELQQRAHADYKEQVDGDFHVHDEGCF